MKPCPFCGKSDRVATCGTQTECCRCEVIVSSEVWQRRPIEDQLTNTLDEAAEHGGVWPV